MDTRKNGKGVTPEMVYDNMLEVAETLNKPPWKVTITDMDREGKYPKTKITDLGGLPLIKNTFLEQDRDEGSIRSMQEVRTGMNKLRRSLGDHEALMDRIEKAVEDMPAIKPSKWQAKDTQKRFKRDLHLLLSDMHFGADLDARETLHKFGPLEESRALGYIAKNVCDYKLEHREDTSLTVDVLGDIIENQLHPGGNAEELHIQFCRAVHLLIEFFDVLSNNFKLVRVNFAVGNHGRDKSIHPQRATASKYNALETGIYYAVRRAFREHKNISFVQPRTPWVDYETFGIWTYCAHGDTNFNVGSVGKAINIESITAKVNLINSDRPASKKYMVFHVGHLHQPTVIQLPSGVYIIVNGALTPANPFAQIMNIMKSRQIQVMYESTAEHPVGDFRYIDATDSHKDKALDKIITPFTDL